MGVNATEVYLKHRNNHLLTDEDIESMLSTVHLISEITDSKQVVFYLNLGGFCCLLPEISV